MKRILAFLCACSLVFILAGCKAEDAKNDIFSYVQKNYNMIVEACEANDMEALCAFDKIEKVAVVDGYIIVYCSGEGIAPSSQDYGFYYSEENLPVAVDCNLCIVGYTEDLSPEGKGYQCIIDGNIFYTKHIMGNIYFYSNAY
ncbi:MAG: hypothetical protein IKK72_05885 [Oscillospiraceae bacterium]|nr:hypothetical protein [Oscillospiraceae bacterium]